VLQSVDVPERHLLYDIEMTASLAVMQVLLENYGLSNVKVKWLNDLWFRGHKLLGALAEFKGVIEGEMIMLY